jgi:aminoglycoside phosphotransferase (APT) family kinase protein
MDPQGVLTLLAGIPIFAGLDLTRASLRHVGGITNRSYRVAVGEHAWVVRLPGAAAQSLVDRAAEGRNAAAMAALGLTIPDLYFDTATPIPASGPGLRSGREGSLRASI